MPDSLYQIILALIPIIGAILTYILVPLIKANTDSVKLLQYEAWVRSAVQCAEQLYNQSGQGRTKKEFVLDFLNKTINEKKQVLTQKQLEVLLESAVKQLKIDMK